MNGAVDPKMPVLAAIALAASAAGVWISIYLAHRKGILDIPNERSSHTIPTPRMGGVPMVAASVLTFACWIYLVAGDLLHMKALLYTLIFALLMAVLGFCDDVSGLSPLFRFLVQFAVAVMLLWAGSNLFSMAPLPGWAPPRLVWTLGAIFWILWMLNLYNFMDGIDGLAGGEAAIASSFFFFLFAREGESGWAVVNLLVAASAMGFLVHNWPPARVFMGDAGSAFLGAFYGMQSVLAPLSTKVPFVVLVLPFSNFILDTTFTLVRRFLRGEKWYQAHRSHYYQRMTTLGMTHEKVTILELLFVILCCIFAELYLRVGGTYRVVAIIVVLVSFLCAGLWVNAREGVVDTG